MLITVGVVLSLIFICEISKCEFEMPGGPLISPPDRDDEVKTVVDLKSEFGGRVSEGICRVFQKGVSHQLGGHPQLARREYAKLERIARRDGSVFNLADVSRTLRHNVRLLDDD